MKLTLIFLSLFVAATHQQYYLGRVFGFPWLSHFTQQLAPVRYLNQYLPYDNYLSPMQVRLNQQYDEEVRPELITPILGSQPTIEDENNFSDVQARIKNFKRPTGSTQQQNARFFFATSNSGNPKLKTVTFTLTSTCTRISFTSCIPARAFARRAPGNFNPTPCRRKRDLEFEMLGENDQFPIISPSQLQLVEPTEIEEPVSERESRETKFEVSSSILRNDAVYQSEESEIEKREKERQRKGRFYYLWQSFATGTTITTWSVESTTLTQTFAPALAAGAFLPCLPPGYFVCPAGNNNGK